MADPTPDRPCADHFVGADDLRCHSCGWSAATRSYPDDLYVCDCDHQPAVKVLHRSPSLTKAKQTRRATADEIAHGRRCLICFPTRQAVK